MFQLQLDRTTGVPVYRQIRDQISTAVAAGQLTAGDRLAAAKAVAEELGINPNTVLRAYRELEWRGIVETRQGLGTFVCETKPEPEERDRRLTQLASDFLARTTAEGFTPEQLLDRMLELSADAEGQQEV